MTPDPGIYPNVPLSVYLGWDCCSASRLTDIANRSPAYCRHRIDHPEPSTDAMRLGSAAHTAILEPSQLEARYGRLMPGDGRTKAVRAHKADLEEAGLIPLRPGDWDAIEAMRDSVWSHPRAAELLDACTDFEVSLVWDWGGTLFKGRPDGVGPGYFVDLKITASASPERFGKHMEQYGIHRQAMLYQRAFSRLGFVLYQPYIVAVESTPPHEVAVYRPHADTMRAAEIELERLRELYHECDDLQTWPGYGTGEHFINIPEWRLRELLPDYVAPIQVRGEAVDFSGLEVEEG